MQSAVEIANAALMRIGVSRYIDSLSSASVEAQIVNRIYNVTRRRALRRLPWAFAREFRKLGLTTETSKRWKYLYAYPSDALRVFYVSTPENEQVEVEFDPNEFQTTSVGSQQYICTDLAGAYGLIVKDVTDTSLFDPLFEDYLIWELAKDIAAPLSVNASLAELCVSSAAESFDLARTSSLDERYVGHGNYKSEFLRARL